MSLFIFSVCHCSKHCSGGVALPLKEKQDRGGNVYMCESYEHILGSIYLLVAESQNKD